MMARILGWFFWLCRVSLCRQSALVSFFGLYCPVFHFRRCFKSTEKDLSPRYLILSAMFAKYFYD